MAARPRAHNITIPNLYAKLDKRTNRVYWQYKHPISGKFYSLGTDAEEAKQVACESNEIIAEQRTRQILSINQKVAKMRGSREGVIVTSWLDRYLDIQQERLKAGEIKLNTLRQKNKPVELLRQHVGMQYLQDVSTLDIAEIINEIKKSGHLRMAQVFRAVIIDVFKEAQHAGHVQPGHNPAFATKQPRCKVKRQRLSLEEWQTIYTAAKPQYLKNAMLLALVTGQRIGDICNMKFSDIWDDALHITQEKTNTKIALPLDLTCTEIGMSLRDIVSQCRDAVLSKYLVHLRKATHSNTRGSKLSTRTISGAFKTARDNSGIEWPNGNAPSFHEQRSLSERLYRAQGLDTQKLLGHKTQIMTDKYNDDRGKEWAIVAI